MPSRGVTGLLPGWPLLIADVRLDDEMFEVLHISHYYHLYNT